MDLDHPIDPFEYENVAGRIAFGRGAVDGLESTLAEIGGRTVLVVCGENVGANRGTMDPIEAGLGERFAGVFDGTTPRKGAGEAFAGLDVVSETGADALVAVGGGSSLDVSRAMCALHDLGSYDEVRSYAAERGALPVSDDPLSLVAVPTTLAGADLSTGGSVTFYGDEGDQGTESDRDAGGESDRSETVGAGYGDPALLPDTVVYDPDLFETAPTSVLAGSAMNGFDKGLELPYSRHANPLTDAPALRGLSLLAPSLPGLREASEGDDPDAMDRIVAGIVCVQYGRASRGRGLLSIIHAFGHGLRAEGIQQGVAHAVMAPPVLSYLFGEVDGRRELLAAPLGVEGTEEGEGSDPANGVVDVVRNVRDGMDLPTRLRDLDGLERDSLSRVARVVENDSFLANGPEGLDPTREDIERVLDAAW